MRFKHGLFLFVFIFLWVPFVHAELDWTELRQVNFNLSPLDIDVSDNGKLIFILVPGKIQIYDIIENKLVGSIPVSLHFNRISYSNGLKVILVSSTRDKLLKIIQYKIKYRINTNGAPFFGQANAPVEIVVFSDYQCPYCKGVDSVLQQVLEKNPQTVKIIFKQYPLSRHVYSRKAAIAVLAADRQGKFKEFHKKLFLNLHDLSDAKVQSIAKELKLNLKRFNTDLKDPKLDKIIQKDSKEGTRVGVHGTPTIFIDGKLLQDHSLSGFQNEINMTLLKTKR